MKKLLLILLCAPLMFSCGENNTEEESFKSKYTPCYCTEKFTDYYDKVPMKGAAMDKTAPSKYSGFAGMNGRKDNSKERDLRLEIWGCLERYNGHYDYYMKCQNK